MERQERERSVLEAVENNRSKILALAQHLYENPEIALEEVESARYLCEFLRGEGFAVEENYLGMQTAFKATRKNGNGPRIAYTAEYDALPGMGHACGHHLIAAMSVGAGLALAKALDTLEGEVTVFGTPAEETGDGKSYLVDHGAFEGYQAAMMIHPNSFSNVTPTETAIGGIDFTFTGKASHAGARPFGGINALDAVVLFFNNVNAMRQQLRDGARIHGIIQEAGSAANIIPDKGRVRMEMRYTEQDYFEELIRRVVQCAEAAALATGCELEWHHFEPTCQGLRSNEKLTTIFREKMAQFAEFAESDRDFVGSSTDMGNVSQVMPAIQPMLKFVEHGEEGHTKEFLEATIKPYAKERTIEGIKTLALTGLALLEDPELAYHLEEK